MIETPKLGWTAENDSDVLADFEARQWITAEYLGFFLRIRETDEGEITLRISHHHYDDPEWIDTVVYDSVDEAKEVAIARIESVYESDPNMYDSDRASARYSDEISFLLSCGWTDAHAAGMGKGTRALVARKGNIGLIATDGDHTLGRERTDGEESHGWLVSLERDGDELDDAELYFEAPTLTEALAGAMDMIGQEFYRPRVYKCDDPAVYNAYNGGFGNGPWACEFMDANGKPVTARFETFQEASDFSRSPWTRVAYLRKGNGR